LSEALNLATRDLLPLHPELGALCSALGNTLASTTALVAEVQGNNTLRTRDLHLKTSSLSDSLKESLRKLPLFEANLFPVDLQKVKDSVDKVSAESKVETAVATLSNAVTAALGKLSQPVHQKKDSFLVLVEILLVLRVVVVVEVVVGVPRTLTKTKTTPPPSISRLFGAAESLRPRIDCIQSL
jgi:hypothetical protein